MKKPLSMLALITLKPHLPYTIIRKVLRYIIMYGKNKLENKDIGFDNLLLHDIGGGGSERGDQG